MKEREVYNVDSDALHAPRAKSAGSRKHYLPPLIKRERPVGGGVGAVGGAGAVGGVGGVGAVGGAGAGPVGGAGALWERRNIRRPLSGLAVATSPAKKNSIDNLADRYVSRALEKCGDYGIVKQIGSGSFGKVFLARDAAGREWALKKIPLHQALTTYDARCIINEVKVAGSHRCRYLLGARDVFVAGRDLCLVTQYGRRGDLANLIKRRRLMRMPLEEGVIWRYLLQMLISLEYLHYHGVIHRDVKAMNVFLNGEGDLMMGDFGIAKILPTWAGGGMGGRGGGGMGGGSVADTVIGTPLYLSPEMILSKKYGFKVDVWSLGCMLWEMMTLEKAFDARNHYLLNKRILSGLCSSSLPEGRYSAELMELARSMIDIDADKRPSVCDIMLKPCVRRRLEGAGLDIPDLADARVADRLRASVYPPGRVGDWERACEQLRGVLRANGRGSGMTTDSQLSPRYRPRMRERGVSGGRQRPPSGAGGAGGAGGASGAGGAGGASGVCEALRRERDALRRERDARPVGAAHGRIRVPLPTIPGLNGPVVSASRVSDSRPPWAVHY